MLLLFVSVTLVSTDVTPSLDQLTCLAEWSVSGQTIDVAGQTLQVSSAIPVPGTTDRATPPTQTPTSTNITWVYAIIAIVVVGIIIAILLVVVILVVRRRDKPVR